MSEVYPNKYGLVRKVKLQLGCPKPGQSVDAKYLERPIHKLILLLEAN